MSNENATAATALMAIASAESSLKNLLANVQPAKHCVGALVNIIEAFNKDFEEVKAIVFKKIYVDLDPVTQELSPELAHVMASILKSMLPDRFGICLTIFSEGTAYTSTTSSELAAVIQIIEGLLVDMRARLEITKEVVDA